MNFKPFLLTALITVPMSISAYAEDGHAHATGEKPAMSKEHNDGHDHDEKPHFNVQKPESVEAAWAMIDKVIAASRQALKDKKETNLHEFGEKLESAVATLHDHPQAVQDVDGKKLAQALDQLSKTVDRFHHATEDKDMV